MPPRERPSHSSITSPFFGCWKCLSCTNSATQGLDVRGVERSAIPVDHASLAGCSVHYLEQTLPRSVPRPTDERS
jgi:hypothetical protein